MKGSDVIDVTGDGLGLGDRDRAGATTGEQPAEPESAAEQFERAGYLGPLPLLDARRCRDLLAHIGDRSHPAPLDWSKGRAATDPVFFALASMPPLLECLKRLIGGNMILWGAQVVQRRPGLDHAWHTDAESVSADGGFVSVWIGLSGTGLQSGMQLLTGTHLCGKPIQQVAHEEAVALRGLPDAVALSWARRLAPDSALTRPALQDGDALLFDGRLWHASFNADPNRTRTAVLLQYAAAETPVRIPSEYAWPFAYHSVPRPPVVLVAGTDSGRVNRIVPPPSTARGKQSMLTTAIHHLSLPLADDPGRGWKAHYLSRGPTRTFDEMGFHVSVLSPGHSPHPPHAHPEEEILIVLDGEGEIVIAEAPDDPAPRTERLGAGQFAYYPGFQHHTIRNPTTSPVTYLMFKWNAGAVGTEDPLPTSTFDCADYPVAASDRPFTTRRIFEQATASLGKLHAHVTDLHPGAGYDPHVDAHDIAIVMLSGEVEVLGERMRPHGVLYCSAGEMHGMRNVGNGAARYLVFEFHSPGVVARRDESRKRKQDRSRLARRLEVLRSPSKLSRAILRRLPWGKR